MTELRLGPKWELVENLRAAVRMAIETGADSITFLAELESGRTVVVEAPPATLRSIADALEAKWSS